MGPVKTKKTSIQGTTGKSTLCPWTSQRAVDLGKNTVTHSFLVIPECPYPLLGRDLLQKLQATISFEGDRARLTVDPPNQNSHLIRILLTCPLSEEYLLQEKSPPENPPAQGSSVYLKKLQRLFPAGWAESNPPGLASRLTPIVIQLTPTVTPVQVRQYPVSLEANLGITIHICRL